MIKKILSVLGVTAIVAALVLLVAGPASAHIKTVDLTCDTASVSLTYYDQGATALVILDGTMVYGYNGTSGPAGSSFGGHYIQSWPLTSDAAHPSHHLQVTVISTDGAQYNVNYDQTVTGCYTAPPEPVVVPIAPVTQTAPTCLVGVTYTVPEQDARVKYALDAVTGIRPVAGTFPLGTGQSVTIVAHVTAQAIAAGAAPGDYSITITGADALGLANPACHDPLPEPKVVTSDWEDGLYGCGDTSEVQSRTVTTTTYSYDDQYKVVSSDKVETEHQTVALTEAQIAALDCTIVTPTPTPTPTDSTPPVVPVKSLAETGSNPTAPFIGGYLLLVAGIGLIATRIALRKRA